MNLKQYSNKMKKKSKLFKDMSLMTESDLVEFKKNPIPIKQTLHNTDHDKFKDFSVVKQETIEEVGKREGIYRCSQNNFDQASAGYNAKWFKRGAIFGAKWQQEQMYSEEEVKTIINDIVEKHCTYFSQNIKDGVKLEWFEQFKKK